MIDVRFTDTGVEPVPRTAGIERVVGGGDDFHAVDESAQHVILNGSLDEVAVLHAVVGTGQLRERGEVCDLAVPPDDLRVGVSGLQAPEEHLVARAHVRGYRATQPYLDLLEILLRLVAAEHSALHVLVAAPLAGEHRRRIVVVTLGRSSVRLAEVALLGPPFRLRHPGRRTVRNAVLYHHVRPVDTVALAVDPHPALADRILVAPEPRPAEPYRIPRRPRGDTAGTGGVFSHASPLPLSPRPPPTSRDDH